LWVELALQGPTLLACGAALVLAVVLIRRQPWQAILVLLAASLLLLAEMVPTVLEHTLMPRDADEVDVEQFDTTMRALTFAAGVARGLAVALFTGAAFLSGSARRPRAREGIETGGEAPPGEARPAAGPSTGITRR
jgi:hypothetical protein